ncbi:MAG TPA: interleukin-like EMT inducer domain-containing protein, partial [Acidimicrobiales bacterium]
TVPLNGPQRATLALPPPFHRAAPNEIVLRHGYQRPPGARDAAYEIGRTGRRSPADLRVRSGGQPWGNRASIEVNGVEHARNQRGYNLVALEPAGRVLDARVFDTFADATASARLATWVAGLPPGTIVAGAVKDEASGWLEATAVGGLEALGVAGDLRGRYRESHAFVGVKGAPPGSALEALGPRRVELEVGRAAVGLGLELTEFALAAAQPGP